MKKQIVPSRTSLAMYSGNLPALISTTLQRKIRVKTNLPLLAAFFRMLFDLGFFDMDNKSRFCRVIVNFFDTQYKKNLSADNFKNHFDAPSPEEVDKLIALLVKMQHYLRNFKFNL